MPKVTKPSRYMNAPTTSTRTVVSSVAAMVIGILDNGGEEGLGGHIVDAAGQQIALVFGPHRGGGC